MRVVLPVFMLSLANCLLALASYTVHYTDKKVV